MSDAIQVTIANDSVRQIIEAKVHLAVAEALSGEGSALVSKLVEAVLLTESTDKAYEYGYHGKKKPTVLEHTVRTMIVEEAQKGIQAWAEEHREEIAEKIRAAMSRRSFANQVSIDIARQLAEAHKYRLSINVTPSER